MSAVSAPARRRSRTMLSAGIAAALVLGILPMAGGQSSPLIASPPALGAANLAILRGAQLNRHYVEQAQDAGDEESHTAECVADRAVLDFAPAPEVSERVIEDMVATLESSLAPGVEVDELRAHLDSGDLQGLFSLALGFYGYSDRNLADVITAFLAIAWAAVHDSLSVDERQGYDAIRATTVAALTCDPDIIALTDAELQELAETLILGLTLVVAPHVSAFMDGEERPEQLSADTRTMVVDALGIDLAEFSLTPQGFEPL